MSNTIRVGAMDDISFVTPGQQKKSGKYDAILKELAALRPGQCVIVPLGNLDPNVANNRINSVMRRVDIQPPEGCVWRRKTTKNNEIAICAKRVMG